jgi:transcription-repair coupling factor (superfamily II helicase)
VTVAGLCELLPQIPAFRELSALARGRAELRRRVLLLRAARPALVAALHAESRRPLFVLSARADAVRTLAEQLRAWSPQPDAVLAFPAPAALPFEHAAWGEDTRRARLQVLAALSSWQPPAGEPEVSEESLEAESAPPLVVASARALVQKTLPRREFLGATRTLRIGQPVALDRLLAHWVAVGYEPAALVEIPGSFSRRGGIIDLFPPHLGSAVRIELFGDEIESLRLFDPATQRSHTTLESLMIPPAREALPRHLGQVPPALAAPEDAAALAAGSAFATIEFYLPLLYSRPASLLDYLPDDALVILEDRGELFAALDDHAREAETLRGEWLALQAEARPDGAAADHPAPDAWPLPFFRPEALAAALAGRDRLELEVAAGEDESAGAAAPGAAANGSSENSPATDGRPTNGRPGGDQTAASPAAGSETGPQEAASTAAAPLAISDLSEAFISGPHFGGQLRATLDFLRRARAARERTVVVSRQAERLAELWSESEPPLGVQRELRELPPRGTLSFVQGALAGGFSLRAPREGPAPLPEILLHLLSDAELFGWLRPEPRRRRAPRRIAPETFYADLRPGDYVVHLEHGIGRFGGLVRRVVEGIEREYLLVEYAGGDVLYVPGHHADRLSRYIGADARPPALHRLGAAEWSQLRQRTEKAVAELADELLALYAARELASGHAYAGDTAWQHELESSFAYVETEDQLRAIAEVKRDMEEPRPMDRLICGDVGYGKTEVALRAAFKAVQDGKQVAVLVPTTVLAQQHFNTFRERLKAFPVTVEMLSRFRSRAEQQRIVAQLAAGTIDIVIGTHRLFNPDVQFKDLGLLIIDEEQRFGVVHKERLKQLRTEVDVLTLTATPIPRTLYMSLIGARDISMIETAPEERLAVQTYLGEYNDRVVRQAILRELDRGGQVFYVHNRVQGIEQVARRLRELVPDARLATGHGQLDEDELEQVMMNFADGRVDVLLSTSIIESGLDIPNANTLIIDHADWFGLAQLYQLRGRVGRGAQRAYAYLLYDHESHLTPEARDRLAAIAEARELGAGYTIAMRDLEIRGAGDMLGARQSGHIAAVGFDLYTRLLARAVQRERAERGEQPAPAPVEPLPELVTIDLPFDVLIPPGYVPDDKLRLQLYRRLAGLASLAQIDAVAEELADRFGPLPPAVANLLYQLRLKVLAARAGVEAIGVEDGQIALRLPALDQADRLTLQRRLGPGVRVTKTHIWLPRDLTREEWTRELVAILEELAERPPVRTRAPEADSEDLEAAS